MPREKDPFWDYVHIVEFLPKDKCKWKCNFCHFDYRGSVTRIKAHLAGLGGYGIHACKVVDDGLRSEAQKALKAKGPVEPSNGLEGNVQGSSYPQLISSGLTQGPHQPVTVSNEDAWRGTSFTAMPNLSSHPISTVGARSSAVPPFHETNLPNQPLPAHGTISQQDFSFSTQPPQSQAGDYYIQLQSLSYPGGGGDLAPNMPSPVNAKEGAPNAEVPQDGRTDYAHMDSQPSTCGLLDKNTPTRKRKLEEVSNREADMDESETWCRKSLPLVTTELVGEESEEAIKEICNYLTENEINIIGIYGMGGVGKTAILMHVHNRVLHENPAFSNVFWVSVPQKFSVYELQDEIANAVGLDSLSKDKDVKRRASILHRHLEKMKSSILLLDGLWMHFEVKDVGIPIKKGGLKLVLTTRSLDVCHKMLCQKQIIIGHLLEPNDSWSLFLEKLDRKKELPSEVEKIVRFVLYKCGGLPLGIIEIATHMRGVEEVHEWNDLLQKLQESRMELDVLKELKLSYVNLDSPQVQRCFLHLVLCFGESFDETSEEELVESLIDEGLLSGIATRQKQHDQGKTILDNLRKACLWDDSEEEEEYGNVHPLIRDMALQIATSTTHMVKARMGLEEIPGEEFWTDGLERVFLESNHIKEIPYGISPNCPKLTSLLLNDNYSLEAIDGSFFKHLKSLKVLDLSETKIRELPDSISHLESLEALLLRGCQELHRIPCVGKLGSLRKLNLRRCRRLKEAPEGMEMLVKLTYLDLRDTGIETLPEGVLGKLLNLQYLAIEKVRAGEEIKLRKVEELYCSVPNVETFNACTRFLEQNSSRKYALAFGLSKNNIDWYCYKRSIFIESCHSIETRKDGGNGGDGGALLLPKNVQLLRVGGCGGVKSLCEVGALEDLEDLVIKEWENLEEVGSVDFPRLRSLKITGCRKLKRLWEERQGPLGAPNLEKIIIESCEKLEEIIGTGGGPVPSGVVTCGRLIHLIVDGCNKMKRVLLTQDMLLHLPSLDFISVTDCEGIEEIISGGSVPIGAPPCLLRILNIEGCNKMKRVLQTQDMLLHLPSLELISVRDCEGIEEIIGIGGGPVPSGVVTCGRQTRLMVDGCNNMKRVLSTQDMLLHLPFLLEISVKNCKGMEVIIGAVANTTHASFAKLTNLTLENLPELKSICDGDGTVSCGSPNYLWMKKCPKLKRIPVQLPLLDDGLPPSLPYIWIDPQTWESLECDYSPLQRFLNFLTW